MRIYKNHECRPPRSYRGIALGFFDGLHRGHLDLIRTLLFACSQNNWTSAVLTFSKHPGRVLFPHEDFPGYLDTLPERLDHLAETGLDEAHVYDFNKHFAAQEPQSFLNHILLEKLGARLIVVGPDYRFGSGGKGDVSLLRSWSKEQGIQLIVVDEVLSDHLKISSSLIREKIRQGLVRQAAALLSRPYQVRGSVVPGRGLGKQLGFPTANVTVPDEKVCPAYGVYASLATVGQRTYHAITNIGLRPTVDQDASRPLIETHLYDTDIPLHGQKLTIELLKKIRNEKQFRSILELSTQVKKDLETVRLWHRQSEQSYVVNRVQNIPVYRLYSERFAQSVLHIVFQVRATPRQLACHALLARVLTATCRSYPGRTALAMALDNLYGAVLDSRVSKTGDIQRLVFSVEALTYWGDDASPFRDACAILYACVTDPDLDSDGFFQESVVEAERQNVMTALAARENDHGKWSFDRSLVVFCENQVHGLHATGSLQDVATITREELQEAYMRLLQHMDCAVYLGGRINDAMIDQSRLFLERLPRGVRSRFYPGRDPSSCVRANTPVKRKTEYKSVEQARLVLAYEGLLPGFLDRTMTGTLLNSMLGGDAHSQLFNVIREEMGLAYQVFSLRLAPLSALFILAGVSPESAEMAIAAIEEQVDCLAKGEFNDRLVAQSRQMLESAIISAYDNLSDMLEIQAASRLNGFYPDRDHMVHKIRTISREEIQACAQQLKLGLVYVLTADKTDQKTAEDENHDD